MKRIAILLTLALFIPVFVQSCSDRERIKERIEADIARLHKERKAEPVPVKVLDVHATEYMSGTSYVGRVEPARSAVVFNRYPGIVERVNVKEGSRVVSGQTIAVISSESVKSAYDIARSSLDEAEDGYARASQVYGSGSVTEQKMVEIRSQLEKARAAEKAARQALSECEVKAPFSGVVGEVSIHEGESLEPVAPIVRIVDVQSVEIHFNVPENEYAGISVGDTATVEVPALKESFQAVVAVRGVDASPVSHSYDFTLKGMKCSASLMPGMVCKVRMSSPGGTDVVVPASAVMTDGGGRYVWSVGGDHDVQKTYISVGGFEGNGIIVSEGLEEGDRIIVEGSRKVSTGMKVEEQL